MSLNDLNPSNMKMSQKMDGKNWGSMSCFVVWFVVFVVLFWLMFYSLKPNFVVSADGTGLETGKVLLASVAGALVLVVIIWFIKSSQKNKELDDFDM